MIECIRSSKKGRIQMKRYPLTKEFVKELNENPNVQKATEWAVYFTAEFKQLAYEELYRGKSVREIFAEAGLDCEKLGDKRLANFKLLLMQQANREEGFEDMRKDNYRKEGRSSEAQMSKKIKQLEHRLAYLEQENEFLKKIREAEKAGAKNCHRK